MDAAEATSSSSPEGHLAPRAAAPGPAELLRATLEKIVFFEWRVSELAAELAAAQARAAAAEQERARAAEESHLAQREAHAARHQLTELESERARLASLLARPAHGAAGGAALEAERQRAAELAAELADARREVQRQKDERARWLQEMIDQARRGDEAPAALAQFISELRSEVIALRERQRACDELLAGAGLAPPLPALAEAPRSAPERPAGAIEAARALWAEGRLDLPGAQAPGARPAANALPARADPRLAPAGASAPPAPAMTDLLPGLAALRAAPAVPSPPPRPIPAAQRALAEQCLRGLVARDPLRRAQAARHLAALPLAAAAPPLAAALGRETEPRARAAIARALAACGGEEAGAMVLRLFSPEEPALVRLAALDALAAPGGPLCRAALEAAASDPAPPVRRRAASLALSAGGADDLLARLFADPDASVRAAAGGGDHLPEAPLAEEELRAGAGEGAPGSRQGGVEDSEDSQERSLGVAHAPPPTMLDDPGTSSSLPRPPPLLAGKQAGDTARELDRSALNAVRAAIFGLTEDELCAALDLAVEDGRRLSQRLVDQGLLSRRGRRLVPGGAAASRPPPAERGA